MAHEKYSVLWENLFVELYLNFGEPGGGFYLLNGQNSLLDLTRISIPQILETIKFHGYFWIRPTNMLCSPKKNFSCLHKLYFTQHPCFTASPFTHTHGMNTILYVGMFLEKISILYTNYISKDEYMLSPMIRLS